MFEFCAVFILVFNEVLSKYFGAGETRSLAGVMFNRQANAFKHHPEAHGVGHNLQLTVNQALPARVLDTGDGTAVFILTCMGNCRNTAIGAGEGGDFIAVAMLILDEILAQHAGAGETIALGRFAGYCLANAFQQHPEADRVGVQRDITVD